MSKRFKVLLPILLTFMAFSCTSTSTSYIYYQNRELDKPLKGKFNMVSCQLRKVPIEWCISTLSINEPLLKWVKVPFNKPEIFLTYLLENITKENISKLKVSPLNSISRKEFLKHDVFNYLAYTSLDGLIPVYDDKDKHNQMDPELLTFLNQNNECDYYVVFDGDIINYEIPRLSNCFEFSLEYEISLIVYDREGEKRLSRHFSKLYKRIPDNWKNGDIYYDLLKRTVQLYDNELNQALDLLISTDENGNSSIDKLIKLN